MKPVFSSREIAVNGIRFNVVVEGNGPDVLLVHGFPDDHMVWRRQIPVLVDAGYRVVAPDLRGCGESEAPDQKSSYRIDQLVGDLVGILDALGIDKVRLVGHDWGAVLAWQLVLKHPERIDRYAALSVGHPLAYARGGLKQKLKGWYVLFFQLRGLADAALRLGNWSLFRKLTQFPEEAGHWVERLGRPGRLTSAMDYYRANIGIIIPRPWPRARVPVMGIWSDGDRFLTEKQMTDSQPLVDAPWRYARIEGANHWLQLDAPERVNALLLDYLH